MSAKLTLTCDGCGKQATLEMTKYGSMPIPPFHILPNIEKSGMPILLHLLFDLPVEWMATKYDKPPWMIHACSRACKAVVELKYFAVS
jgi:hypothetical protein